jgi:type I restriction enzyme M protein
MPTYLERALADGHAKFTGEGKQQKIIYIAVNHIERYSGPEEEVRAEFWAEAAAEWEAAKARFEQALLGDSKGF